MKNIFTIPACDVNIRAYYETFVELHHMLKAPRLNAYKI